MKFITVTVVLAMLLISPLTTMRWTGVPLSTTESSNMLYTQKAVIPANILIGGHSDINSSGPSMAVSRYGTILVAYQNQGCLNGCPGSSSEFAVSLDNGTTFTSPRAINSTFKDEANVSVSASPNGTFYVTYIAGYFSNGTDAVYITPVYDNGTVLGRTSAVNNKNITGSYVDRPWVYTADNGTIYVVYGNGTSLFLSTSYNGGTSFSTELVSSGSEYIRSSGIYGYRDNLYVIASRFGNNSSSVVLFYSLDNGSNWGEQLVNSSGGWNSPAMITTSDGSVIVAWVTSKAIYVENITNGYPIPLNSSTGLYSEPRLSSYGSYLFVSWLEANSSNPLLPWNIYGAISYNGGNSFGNPVKISSQIIGYGNSFDVMNPPLYWGSNFITDAFTSTGIPVVSWDDKRDNSTYVQVYFSSLPSALNITLSNILCHCPIENGMVNLKSSIYSADMQIIKGRVNFTELPYGNYTVKVYAPYFDTAAVTVPLNLSSDGNLSMLLAPFSATLSNLTVVVDETGTGNPIGGVNLSLTKLNGGVPIHRITSVNGIATFYNLTAGNYILFAYKSGYTKYSHVLNLADNYTFTINLGRQNLLTGNLIVTVLNYTTALPVAGAVVTASQYVELTGSSGKASFKDIGAGEYLITVTAKNYINVTKSALVPVNGTVNITVMLRSNSSYIQPMNNNSYFINSESKVFTAILLIVFIITVTAVPLVYLAFYIYFRSKKEKEKKLKFLENL